MAHALVESHEFHEQISQAVERAERKHRRSARWTKELSVSTAVIAVATALSSLGASHSSNDALMHKNEAIHLQARAADQWAYYQAKGIKSLLFETRADVVGSSNPGLARAYLGETRRYQKEQAELKAAGNALEEKVAEANRLAEEGLHYHHYFALAVTLLQIAIALSAIAALTRRKSLWHTGLAISVVGLLFALLGGRFLLL